MPPNVQVPLVVATVTVVDVPVVFAARVSATQVSTESKTGQTTVHIGKRNSEHERVNATSHNTLLCVQAQQ